MGRAEASGELNETRDVLTHHKEQVNSVHNAETSSSLSMQALTILWLLPANEQTSCTCQLHM